MSNQAKGKHLCDNVRRFYQVLVEGKLDQDDLVGIDKYQQILVPSRQLSELVSMLDEHVLEFEKKNVIIEIEKYLNS